MTTTDTWQNRITSHGHASPAELQANPNNWRVHPEAQQRALREMLDRVGWVQSVIINERTGNVVDGHLRIALAIERQEDTIPVAFVDLSPEEERLVLAALDPLAGLAVTDEEMLAELTAGLAPGTALEEMFAGLLGTETRGRPVGKTDPDEVPPHAPALTEVGDTWLLGDHKIVCADATADATWRALFNARQGEWDNLASGRIAQPMLVFTDPPYGVAYTAEGHDVITNDELEHDKLVGFLRASFARMAAHVRPDAAFYIWHASATREEYSFALKAAGLRELQYLIWVKPALVLGHADYQWQHEPCFYAAVDGHRPEFYGERGETTVWHVAAGASSERAVVLGRGLVLRDGTGHEMWLAPKPPKSKNLRTLRLPPDAGVSVVSSLGTTDTWEIERDTRKAEHPTQKPVALAVKAIENSSRPGDIVVDAFLGSGGTLIAAEQTGRVCYAIEIEPRYVDLAVKRWEDYTGEAAIRQRGQP